MKAADVLERRRDEVLDVMVTETGFTRADNAGDLGRCVQTLQTSAEEAKRLTGDIIPIDAAPGHAGEFAFTLRVPLGAVAAITPFNSPLNTVAHKVAPAIAAGNSVVLKPASYTPLTACLLGEVLEEAGLPPGWLNIVHGAGSATGRILCDRPEIRFFAFTGGGPAGLAIQRAAGLRRTQMELGNISATIVCADANLDKAAALCARASFRKAGQVCVSVQRLFVDRGVVAAFTERLAARAAQMKVGDPRDAETAIGPMIDIAEAERAEQWVEDATAGGAEVLVGGKRDGSVFSPTVLTNVDGAMKVVCEEIFAPVVSVIPVRFVRGSLVGRQRHALRAFRRHLHARHRSRVARGPQNGSRPVQHQQYLGQPGRSHALWRQQGIRIRPRRTARGHARNDR